MDKLRFMDDYSILFPDDDHELSESSSTKYKANYVKLQLKSQE